ncbi:MAG: hypothetical protein MI807_02195 [Verrucomicrobiales bacterium]|nr:hypothetical protein [Verrucomicrobiales bacterium]
MRTLFYNHGPDDSHVAIYVEFNPPRSHVSTKSPHDREFVLTDEKAAQIFEQFDHLSLRSRYLHDEGTPRDPLKSHLFWLYDHSTKNNTKYTVPDDEVQTVSGLDEFLDLLRNTAKIGSEQADAGKPDPVAS